MSVVQFIDQIIQYITRFSPTNRMGSRLRYRYYKNKLKGCRNEFISGIGLFIDRPSNVTIGKNVYFGEFCYIHPSDDSRITIGDDCIFGQFTYINSSDHIYSDPDIPINQQGRTGGDITIGNNCWFGVRCIVLKNVVIGDGCVIGAGSVVTRSIPENSIAAGVPARVIGVRAANTTQK